MSDERMIMKRTNGPGIQSREWRVTVQPLRQRPRVQRALSPHFDRVESIQPRCGATRTPWLRSPHWRPAGPVDQLVTATIPSAPKIGPPESP